MTDIIGEAERLLEAATPGGWECEVDESEWRGGHHACGPQHRTGNSRKDASLAWADAAFIAAAPRLVRGLIAELKSLRVDLVEATQSAENQKALRELVDLKRETVQHLRRELELARKVVEAARNVDIFYRENAGLDAALAAYDAEVQR